MIICLFLDYFSSCCLLSIVTFESSAQFSHSVVSNSLRPCGLQHARPPYPSPTPGAYSNSCPSNHLILCHLLLLPPSIFLSIRVFSNESHQCSSHQCPKYWSFSFNISPSSEYSGLNIEKFEKLIWKINYWLLPFFGSKLSFRLLLRFLFAFGVLQFNFHINICTHTHSHAYENFIKLFHPES